MRKWWSSGRVPAGGGHPGYGFGTSEKWGDQKVQAFISKQHMDPDPASPGHGRAQLPPLFTST